MTTHPTPRTALTLASLALLGACSSPPKPPTVDESQKRPANALMAIELQVCKNDLQNTRIQANESIRLAETTTATLAHMAARQQLIASIQPTAFASSSSVSTAPGSRSPPRRHRLWWKKPRPRHSWC